MYASTVAIVRLRCIILWVFHRRSTEVCFLHEIAEVKSRKHGQLCLMDANLFD